MKRRARNLRDQDIERIVRLLDTWTGPLTWSLLVEALAERTGHRYSRQALHKRARIQMAFSMFKRRENRSTPPVPSYREQLRARIETLKARCARLEQENDALLQQFVVWQYNALSSGLTAKELSRPLPSLDRPGRFRVGALVSNQESRPRRRR